jgi:hypothetical protein
VIHEGNNKQEDIHENHHGEKIIVKDGVGIWVIMIRLHGGKQIL